MFFVLFFVYHIMCYFIGLMYSVLIYNIESNKTFDWYCRCTYQWFILAVTWKPFMDLSSVFYESLKSLNIDYQKHLPPISKLQIIKVLYFATMPHSCRCKSHVTTHRWASQAGDWNQWGRLWAGSCIHHHSRKKMKKQDSYLILLVVWEGSPPTRHCPLFCCPSPPAPPLQDGWK